MSLPTDSWPISPLLLFSLDLYTLDIFIYYSYILKKGGGKKKRPVIDSLGERAAWAGDHPCRVTKKKKKRTIKYSSAIFQETPLLPLPCRPGLISSFSSPTQPLPLHPILMFSESYLCPSIAAIAFCWDPPC